MHHEAIAIIKSGQGIEGIIKEDNKILMRWNISKKKTTPTRELLRAIEMAEAKDVVLIEVYMTGDLLRGIEDVRCALDNFGVNVNLLSEDT